MKTNFLKTLATLVLASVLVAGCTNLRNMVNRHATDAEYVQTPDPMEMHNDQVKINIAGSYKPNFFHRRAGVVFQPELQYEGGSLLLKPITLRGESVTDLQGTTIPRSGGSFTYTDVFPYKPEYREAKLIVNPTAFPARRARAHAPTSNEEALEVRRSRPLSEKIIATGINTTPLLYDNLSGQPTLGRDNYKKPDNIFQKSALFFAKDLWNLNMNLPTNRAETARAAIAEMNNALGNEMEIASIKITAWASPEGELARNNNLSRERSKTGERFLRDAYKRVIDQQVAAHNRNLPRGAKRITARELMKELPLTIDHKGEDWDGFMAALRASNVRDRDKILNVIQSAPNRDRREQEMRNMIVIYQEIEDQLLPPLRRAEMVIELVVPAKTNEEMSTLALSNPSELTVEELLFAATLTQDSDTKMKIYTAATEVYPNDWRGFNNVAFIHIQNQNFDAAAVALQQANTLSPNNDAVLNNLGIIALSKGNLDEAKTYFNNAKSKGNAEAAGNLAPILIKEGDYATAVSAIGNRPGNLNLALAQILLGDLAAAKQTLATAADSPRANYLRAIVGAREDNANEVYSNLRKTNAELKKQAQGDVEFRKFANTVEFTNATR
ncbi:MAG: tetratricopeptide repeat protein [Bacteroidales bacterium]|jgi:Tfp pilus assembly protein PilF/outer membrane murein-binding lipoprotein Lpp|nr:tetratricopeptide repeat protein [Bacteroidales bacterium]